ncbi:response regulator transcription factor [Asanoa siamensis]|uniref:Sensory transduction protein RegX3 n=1 Tax=Asanoa siamensis TaxID=926357 RepID=A0ABQ4CKJ6_9ACTN|nr:response regulator transcription factor [Asanoa siamensis]GIF71821.1 DNA-binding response regulator [Asanoa siamensis]
MRITVIEDDDRVARGLVTVLTQAGFEVHRIATAAEAVRLEPSDVVLVDLALPDGDGLDVIRRLRDQPETAVIAVTARSEEHERVRGLRAGADDYIVKPFGVQELLARIEAVLRRTRAARAARNPAESLVVGPMRIDVGTREVAVDGAPVPLTRKEFELLLLLARRAPDVVSRDVILDQIWGAAWESSSRTLDTHIAALRHKVGAAVHIRTVHGVGYRLAADQSELIG